MYGDKEGGQKQESTVASSIPEKTKLHHNGTLISRSWRGFFVLQEIEVMSEKGLHKIWQIKK